MSTEDQTAAFVEEHGITARVERVSYGPGHGTGWPVDARHWKVRLRYGRRSMTVPFSQGGAWDRHPTATDVLECLISDASSMWDGQDFENWCAEIGYDTDSREAERTYKAVERQTAKLRRFLGDDFDAAVWGNA